MGRRFKVMKCYFTIGRHHRNEEWSEFCVILLLSENVLISDTKGKTFWSLDVVGYFVKSILR